MPSTPLERLVLRILVVDDSRDVADGLAIQLRNEGHEAWTADDGDTAISAALAYRPDLIFMDLGMPRMNGLDAARLIRLESASVTIVALSGWGRDEDRTRSQSAGIDLHIMKPMSTAQLAQILCVVRRRVAAMDGSAIETERGLDQ